MQKIVFFTFPIIWGVNSNCINFNQFSIFLPKYPLVIYFCEIIIVLVLVFHVAFSLFETRTKQDIFSSDFRSGRLTAESGRRFAISRCKVRTVQVRRKRVGGV